MSCLNKQEIEELRQIHDNSFPFPDFGNPTYVRSSLVRDAAGKLLAAGILKVTTETILIVNPEASRLQKAALCKQLFETLREELFGLGLDDTHLFLLKDEEHFSKLLKKHFNFQEATGKAMYYGKKAD